MKRNETVEEIRVWRQVRTGVSSRVPSKGATVVVTRKTWGGDWAGWETEQLYRKYVRVEKLDETLAAVKAQYPNATEPRW